MALKATRFFASIFALAALAIVLCACGANVDPEGGSAERTSGGQSAFERFEELIANQSPIYSFTGTEETTIISGDLEHTVEKIYSGIADDSESERRAYVSFEETDTYFAGEYYQNGNVIISVLDGVATDISEEVDADSLAETGLVEDRWLAKQLTADDLAFFKESEGELEFSFVVSDEMMEFLELVDVCASGEASFTFNDSGDLVKVVLEARGKVTENGEPYTSSAIYTRKYSGFGKGEVPACPIEATVASKSLSPEETKAQLAQLIEDLPQNITAVVDAKTTYTTDSGQSVSSDLLLEMFRDESGWMSYLEQDGDEDNGIYTWVKGSEMVVAQGENVSFLTYEDSGDDPTGSKKALQVLDCITEAVVYEDSVGSKEYYVTMDPAKVVEINPISGMETLGSFQCYYLVNGDGQLESVRQDALGVPNEGGEGDTLSVETETWYSDFGTTEVPEMPTR